MFVRNTLTVWTAILLLSGLLLSACFPLSVGEGSLKGAVLDQGDQIRVVFQDAEGIKYGIVNVTDMASELVSSDGTLGDSQVAEDYGYLGSRGVLAMDPQGRPHVLYYSSDSLSLIHACKQAGAWEAETIATMNDCPIMSWSWPSIAIDDSGDLHVSYANSDCTSGPCCPYETHYEIHYANRHEGIWSDEVVVTDSLTYTNIGFPIFASRIALGLDQNPVIAVGATFAALEMSCSDASISVAERMEGGGWQVDEIFTYHDPCDPYEWPDSFQIKDLSLAVGPSGDKAVGFVSNSRGKAASVWDYSIMIDNGTGWTGEFICGGWCDDYYPPCAADGKAQDIAFSHAGQLHAMFTREWSEYASYQVEQSISLASRTDTGWVEETLWDNTLYPAELAYGSHPHLLMPQFSAARILYNSGQRLMSLTE